MFLRGTVAALWLALCIYMSATYFREAVAEGRGFFERPQSILTGIGGLTVGCMPLLGVFLLHRYHKSRLRGRLLRDKARIERQLARLDEKQSKGSEASSLPADSVLPN